MAATFYSMDGINAQVQGPCSNTTTMSPFGVFEKFTNWENSSLTSHDSRGFQISPNGLEFESKWYGES